MVARPPPDGLPDHTVQDANESHRAATYFQKNSAFFERAVHLLPHSKREATSTCEQWIGEIDPHPPPPPTTCHSTPLKSQCLVLVQKQLGGFCHRSTRESPLKTESHSLSSAYRPRNLKKTITGATITGTTVIAIGRDRTLCCHLPRLCFRSRVKPRPASAFLAYPGASKYNSPILQPWATGGSLRPKVPPPAERTCGQSTCRQQQPSAS